MSIFKKYNYLNILQITLIIFIISGLLLVSYGWFLVPEVKILGVIAAAIWPIAIVFLVVFCVPAFMALIGLAYVIMSWLH